MMSWDLELLHLINREWTHPALDWLMPAVSAVNAWLPLFALAIILVIYRMGRRSAPLLISLALALVLSDAVISRTLKQTVGRVRPRDAISGVMIRDLAKAKPEFMRLLAKPVQHLSTPNGQMRGSSFPSSHSMNLFAVATVIALFHRRWGIVLYVLAALVAYSRIYNAAHWPSDIPPSIGMGILIGWCVTRLVQMFQGRIRKI